MDGIVESIKSDVKTHKKIITWIIVAVAVFFIARYFYVQSQMSNYTALAQADAAKFSNPQAAQNIIMTGIKEFIGNPVNVLKAEQYATDVNVSYFQAVEDLVVSKLAAEMILSPIDVMGLSTSVIMPPTAPAPTM